MEGENLVQKKSNGKEVSRTHCVGQKIKVLADLKKTENYGDILKLRGHIS